MKKMLAIVALSLLIAAPAYAEDGQVSRATLANLGLGGMQVVSDDAGMQVRGMSSSAWANSMSLFNMALFDPFSGANFNVNLSDASRATDENAGLNSTSTATATSMVVNPAPAVFTITTGANTWTATIPTFTFSGVSMGTSP